jgi:DNA-binding IclR family transcriptional regulator
MEPGGGGVERVDEENKGQASAAAVKTLRLALRLLDVLASAGGSLGVTQLANQVGEPKAKVHRHLTTLKAFGVVEQSKAAERYRLGWKLYQLGQAALEQFDFKRIAEPHAVALRDKVRLSVVLSAPVGGEALVIGSIEYGSGIQISSVPGSIAPATASAQGRIMLAYSGHSQRQRILSEPFPRYTAHTLCDRAEVENRLAEITARFYDYAAEEVMLGINALAAPVFDADEKLIGTVGVVGSIQYVANPPHPDLIAAVQGCAAAISLELGSHVYRGRLRQARPA